MSYRYNTIDIIVGVGMCAIVFGAMLFFVAANGTVLVATPQSGSLQQPSVDARGTTWLQPALGQAIVEKTALKLHSDQITAAAIEEWDQAMLARQSMQSLADDPFGFVLYRAATFPDDHMTRVQVVMGHFIVNFTQRGIRSGVLSADQNLSDFNTGMIRATEAMGQRLDQQFGSTWQATLGGWIVDASQDFWKHERDVQEQLGTAIVHRTQAAMVLEDEWAANQYQLGSLLVAVDRTSAMPDDMISTAAPVVTNVGASDELFGSAVWPEIPMGYLITATVGLCAVFGGRLILSARRREEKALADMQHDAARWIFRMAA